MDLINVYDLELKRVITPHIIKGNYGSPFEYSSKMISSLYSLLTRPRMARLEGFVVIHKDNNFYIDKKYQLVLETGVDVGHTPQEFKYMHPFYSLIRDPKADNAIKGILTFLLNEDLANLILEYLGDNYILETLVVKVGDFRYTNKGNKWTVVNSTYKDAYDEWYHSFVIPEFGFNTDIFPKYYLLTLRKMQERLDGETNLYDEYYINLVYNKVLQDLAKIRVVISSQL